MGWLVRFIHNRDLAVENIKTAYIRQRLVLSAPAQERDALLEKIATGSIRLAPGSLLYVATKWSASASAGSFQLRLPKNPRSARTLIESDLASEVKRGIEALCSSSPVLRAPRLADGAGYMERGVMINGRRYAKGCFVEVVHPIPRARRGENANDPRFFSVVVIDGFYRVSCGRGVDACDELFVAVRSVEIVSKYRSLYIRKRPAEGEPQPALKIIHVDSIVRRIHFVPHFSDESLQCGIGVWDAQ